MSSDGHQMGATSAMIKLKNIDVLSGKTLIIVLLPGDSSINFTKVNNTRKKYNVYASFEKMRRVE